MSFVIEEKEVERLPINVDPEIMSGTPVFDGTRVPIDALFNNLEDGVSLEEFLDNFQTVTREQAVAVLRFSNEILQKLAQTAMTQPRSSKRLPGPKGPLARARRQLADDERSRL